MKVLFITHYASLTSGSNRSMLQLIKELKNNYKVDINVLLPKKGELCDELRLIDVPFFVMHYWPYKFENRSLRHLPKMLFNFISIGRLFHIFKKNNYDIIHINSSVLDIGVYLKLFKKTKHIMHFREYGEFDYHLIPYWGYKYESFVYKHVDCGIAISKSIRDYYLEKDVCCKLKLIYNGIKIPNLKYISKHNNSVIQFCCIGFICKTKNQKIIIDAINYLVNVLNVSDFHLNILGTADEVYLEQLKQIICNNNLHQYITFHGYISQPSELLSSYDVGIMSSISEAFGRVTVEYLLHSLPVIASKCGANMEIVKERKNGLFFELNDVEGLAQCMNFFIKNKKQMVQMGKWGKEDAESRFSSVANTAHIYNLYTDIITK